MRPLSYHKISALYLLSSSTFYGDSPSFTRSKSEGHYPVPSQAQLLLIRHQSSMPRALKVNVAAILNSKSICAFSFLCPKETHLIHLFIQNILLRVCLVPGPLLGCRRSLRYSPFRFSYFKAQTSVTRVWGEG